MKTYKTWLMRLIPIAFLLIYTIGLSEIFYQSQIKATTEKCWEQLATARDHTSHDIATQLNSNLSMLDFASDAIIMNADFKDEKTVLAYLAEVQNETLFDRIDVVFPDGSILVSNGDRVTDNGEKTYAELIAKGSHLSQRVPDFLTGQEAVHAFSPVIDRTGTPIAILGATMYCRTLSETISSSFYGDDAQLFLVDRRDGNLVLDKWHEIPGSIYDMQSYDTPDDYGDKDLITEIMAGNTGRLSYPSQHFQNTSYMNYAPIEGTDFSIIMIVQEDVALADLHEQKVTFTKFGIIGIALLLILVVWIYFVMRRSMQNETRAQRAELELLHKKELELQTQYHAATDRQEFLETMGVNLPGGYHRCSTENGFILSFVSNSFLEITGYTAEQLEKEAHNSYINLVAPEDKEFFMSLEPELAAKGRINCAYRIVRRDGSLRWVQDSTQKVEKDGQQYYQCTLADIHDFVHDLNEAKRAAEESNLAKTTFLFNASHDIRTPMNAISGFARIIEQNADDPEIVKDAIAKIIQSGKTLMTLLNDVLELSRIERGKDELNLEAIDLEEQSRNLFEMFADDMQTSGIVFRKESSILHRNVLCDPIKLSRICMNFLSNAKKFTPKGGTVIFGVEELSSNETTATYRFYTQDSGIGMSKDFQTRAFGQFERERTATESGVTGSGLGLSITKRIVDLMDGQLELQSELGKGTLISVTLTFTLADDKPVTGQADTGVVFDMSGKHVLLVEDNEFNREIAKYILEGMHFTVDEAENGAVCIDKLMNAPAGTYDLILMDIQMPIMDGYVATMEIRNVTDQEIACIPIIAMTANAFEEDKKKCLDVGMNGHIGKPIETESLMQELAKLFH